LVRKRRCTVTIDCVRAFWSTHDAFCARVAIFTQPAPLAAIDVISNRGTYKLGEFLRLSVGHMLSSFAPFKCTDICNVSENYE
jgi:hypothetical protein